MSDSRGASDETADTMLAGAPDGHEIRCYILDMIGQLAQMAAIHGQHDLVSFLAAAPRATDVVPSGAAIN